MRYHTCGDCVRDVALTDGAVWAATYVQACFTLTAITMFGSNFYLKTDWVADLSRKFV